MWIAVARVLGRGTARCTSGAPSAWKPGTTGFLVAIIFSRCTPAAELYAEMLPALPDREQVVSGRRREVDDLERRWSSALQAEVWLTSEFTSATRVVLQARGSWPSLQSSKLLRTMITCAP